MLPRYPNPHMLPTALEALALKVPSAGPKVDVVAIAPWEVPNWVDTCHIWGWKTHMFKRPGYMT
jgi:hypothetical protein